MIDPIDQWIKLTLRKRELTAELKDIERQLEDYQAGILQEWHEDKTQSIKRKGYLVYQSRTLTTNNQESPQHTVGVLARAHMHHCLMVCSQALRAWLRERLHDPKTGTWETGKLNKLPPTVRDAIAVSELYRLNCKKG